MVRAMPARAISSRVADYRKMLEESDERRRRAVKLRADGKTVQEIGNVLGVTKQRASQILKAAAKGST